MRALKRAVRSAIFDRKVNTELFFDSDATADAVLLIAGIGAVVYFGILARVGFGAFSVTALLEAVIYAVVGWRILAVGTWVAATKLFDGSGRRQTMRGLHGHAELAMLLALWSGIMGALGLAWRLAAEVPATGRPRALDALKSE